MTTVRINANADDAAVDRVRGRLEERSVPVLDVFVDPGGLAVDTLSVVVDKALDPVETSTVRGILVEAVAERPDPVAVELAAIRVEVVELKGLVETLTEYVKRPATVDLTPDPSGSGALQGYATRKDASSSP